MVKIPGRFRRVAAAFDEAAARARTPCDESSSGSDHSPENMADLLDLVESFMEREGRSSAEMISAAAEKEESDSDDDGVEDFEEVKERLRNILLCGGGGGDRRRIAVEVEAACGIIGEEETTSSKRQLMAFLRNKGFDAGLCKSRWERFGNNPSGKYEYVDVQLHDARYIVETNLAGEFQIARPTERYLALVAGVPRVFVGAPGELKHLVRLMCNEMRRSMKRVGIHVPPWRRNGFMQAKWFGHYKRTVNEASGRVKGYGSDQRRFGFEESAAKTTAFCGCRDEYWTDDGLKKMGRLTIAFGCEGVDMQ